MPKYSTNIVLTQDRLEEVVDHFMGYDAFAFDIETHGENRGVPHLAPVMWLGLATEEMTVAIPMGHPNGDTLISKATRRKNKVTGKFDPIPAVWSKPPAQLKPSQVWPLLEPLFMSEDRLKIGHGASFDFVGVAKYFGGELPPPPYGDTIVMQWLLDENLRQFGLKEITKRRWGHDYDNEHVGRCVEIWPFSKVGRYQYLDAKYTWLHWKAMDPLLDKQNLRGVYDLEMDVFKAVIKMRLNGARIDEETLVQLQQDFSAELEEIEGRVYKAAGTRFNINSNPQKQKLLYGPKAEGGQGLKPKVLTDTQAPSCKAEALELYPKNPLASTLLEYAEVNTLLGTYINGYLGVEGDPKKPCQIFDGKIHADFVQYGTVSGRFSCRAPNLQNIPRPDTDKGKQIRGLFLAEPGEKLVVADYGQIELVVLAHYSRAKALVDGFNNGIDAHTMTAAKVFNVDFDKVTKEMRQAAKGINFAVVYGAGPDKVAAMAGTTVNEAKGFLNVHQREFPEIYRFKDQVLRTAKTRKPPYIRTLLGRKRRLPGLLYQNKSARGLAERQAVNSLIQGSAADLIKTAMVRLDRALPPEAQLILTVHDELVTRTPEPLAEEVADIVREAMLGEGIAKLLSVPMTSDLKIVDKWAEAK